MTERRSGSFFYGPRPLLAGATVVLVLCCRATTGLAQAVPAGAAPPAAAAPGTQATPPKLPAKTPRQFADELAIVLQRQKTPWQVYANYTRIYQGFAAREAAKTGGNEAVVANRKRLAAHLMKMADLLTAMGEQAKIRDGIRRGGSPVPFEQRQTVFAAAGVQNERLLVEFVRLASALPQGNAAARP